MTARTRCDQWSCRTTVDLDNDPAALQDCGHIICDRCVTCDECEDVCAVCAAPAKIADGIVGALLCDNIACFHAAWDTAFGEGA